MDNPDQTIMLLEQSYEEFKFSCSKLREESRTKDMEVKTLQRELARVWIKDIDDNYEIDWKF